MLLFINASAEIRPPPCPQHRRAPCGVLARPIKKVRKRNCRQSTCVASVHACQCICAMPRSNPWHLPQASTPAFLPVCLSVLLSSISALALCRMRRAKYGTKSVHSSTIDSFSNNSASKQVPHSIVQCNCGTPPCAGMPLCLTTH